MPQIVEFKKLLSNSTMLLDLNQTGHSSLTAGQPGEKDCDHPPRASGDDYKKADKVLIFYFDLSFPSAIDLDLDLDLGLDAPVFSQRKSAQASRTDKSI